MSDANKIFNVYIESKQEPQLHVDEFGTKKWYLNGELHREDGPAIEYTNGTNAWWQHGKCHRIGAPAAEHANGDKYWYVNDKLHRTDGAAIEYGNGTKDWYVDDHQYNDVVAWAKAALKFENKPATQDAVDAKVMQVMQVDLFD